MPTRIYFLTLLSILVILGCKQDKSKKVIKKLSEKELKKIEINTIKINRFDLDLFACNQNDLQNDLQKLKNRYPIFIDTDLSDKKNIEQMRSYLNDPSVITMYTETKKRYPDLTFLERQLTTAFKHCKYYLPDFQVPKVYTYVSGGDFEQPIKYVENNLIIALDMYLGKDFKVYSMWGIPKYISYRMSDEYIIVDCIKEIAKAYIDRQRFSYNTLLEKMIYEGKQLYFLDLCLPNVEDSIKIAYTTSQLGWAETYQGNVWSYFIEHNLLHTTDVRTINKFIGEAPFTSAFSKNSAPRIGRYIGWQIIREYMNKNPKMKITDLLADPNAIKILQQSAYKPKKK